MASGQTASVIRRAGSALLDLIYPPRCVLCRRLLAQGQTDLCPDCRNGLTECGQTLHGAFFQTCVAPYRYDGALRESLLYYKFHGKQGYAAAYGRLLAPRIADALSGQYDLISWVPVSRKRKRQRGYDQARLLAAATARELGQPLTRTLKKVKHNPAQSGLDSAAERRGNVKNAYRPYRQERFAGKRVLLIDDIVTTGSTLSECSRVLQTAGAASVVCAALAAAGKKQSG